MRAEHVEAMERAEALIRENSTRSGHNFGRSIVPPLLGIVAIAAIVGFVFLLDAIESSTLRFAVAFGTPFGIVVVIALVSFVRRRL